MTPTVPKSGGFQVRCRLINNETHTPFEPSIVNRKFRARGFDSRCLVTSTEFTRATLLVQDLFPNRRSVASRARSAFQIPPFRCLANLATPVWRGEQPSPLPPQPPRNAGFILIRCYLKKVSRACRLVSGCGGQPGMKRSTGRRVSRPQAVSGLSLNGPPVRAQVPTAITTRGEAVAS